MSNHTKNAGVFAHELMSTGTVFGDGVQVRIGGENAYTCLLYTSPSPRDGLLSRMPSSA